MGRRGPHRLRSRLSDVARHRIGRCAVCLKMSDAAATRSAHRGRKAQHRPVAFDVVAGAPWSGQTDDVHFFCSPAVRTLVSCTTEKIGFSSMETIGGAQSPLSLVLLVRRVDAATTNTKNLFDRTCHVRGVSRRLDRALARTVRDLLPQGRRRYIGSRPCGRSGESSVCATSQGAAPCRQARARSLNSFGSSSTRDLHG